MSNTLLQPDTILQEATIGFKSVLVLALPPLLLSSVCVHDNTQKWKSYEKWEMSATELYM